MARKGYQGADRHLQLRESARAAQIRQIDNETRGEHLGAQGTQQPHGRGRRSPGRDEVVHQDDLFAASNTVLVNLDLVATVLERVRQAHGGVGELALLANGNETSSELMSDGTTENEAPCFDTGDSVDLRSRPGLHQ